MGQPTGRFENSSSVYSERVALPGDSKTTVHVMRQALHNTVINVVNLGSARRVTEVCDELGGRGGGDVGWLLRT